MPRKARDPDQPASAAKSRTGDALEQANNWLRRDPSRPEDSRAIHNRRAELRRLIERLSVLHPTEACELCLLLEEALDRADAPTGLPAPRPDAPVNDSATAAVLDTAPVGSRLELLGTLGRIARRSGQAFYEAEALLRTAELLIPAGYLAAAQRRYEEAQRVADGASLPLLVCAALGGQARLAQLAGNIFKAHSLYNRQLSAAKVVGEPALMASALCNVSSTSLAMGDHRRAARYAREHLTLARQEGDEGGVIEAQINLGLALRHLPDPEPEKGRRCFEDALMRARRLAHTRLEVSASFNLACEFRDSDPPRAVALAEHARLLCETEDNTTSSSDGGAQLLSACQRALVGLAEQLGPVDMAAALTGAPTLLREMLGPRPGTQ